MMDFVRYKLLIAFAAVISTLMIGCGRTGATPDNSEAATQAPTYTLAPSAAPTDVPTSEPTEAAPAQVWPPISAPAEPALVFADAISFIELPGGAPHPAPPCFAFADSYVANGGSIPGAQFDWETPDQGRICFFGLGLTQGELVTITIGSPYGTVTTEYPISRVDDANGIDASGLSFELPAGIAAPGTWTVRVVTADTTFEDEVEVTLHDSPTMSVVPDEFVPFSLGLCSAFEEGWMLTSGEVLHIMGSSYPVNAATGFAVYFVPLGPIKPEDNINGEYYSPGELVNTQTVMTDAQGNFHATLTITPEMAAGLYRVVHIDEYYTEPPDFALAMPTSEWSHLYVPCFTVGE